LNSGPYRQLSDNLKSGSISEFRYEDLDLGGSFDGEGGYGMGNIRGSESDLVGIGAVHSQWQLTRYVQYLLFNGGGVSPVFYSPQSSHLTFLCLYLIFIFILIGVCNRNDTSALSVGAILHSSPGHALSANTAYFNSANGQNGATASLLHGQVDCVLLFSFLHCQSAALHCTLLQCFQ
jgi:hypothetical protein